MSDGVTLRRAVPLDAGALAAVHVRARHHAYADIVDPRELAQETVEGQEERWAGHLTAAESETWVAAVGGRIAGFVALGRSDAADAAPQAGAVHALYVDPPAQGAGLGSRLLAHGEQRLRELGHRRALLWVHAENGLARAFYERHGWTEDPEGPAHVRPEWTEPCTRYRRDLRD